MKDIKELLQEDVAAEKKCNIFLDSIKYLRKVEEEQSYKKIIQEILPFAEKNIESYEQNNDFNMAEMREYVERYKFFWAEYLKYQVRLIGNAIECEQVRKILNYDRVHLLGERLIENNSTNINLNNLGAGGGKRLYYCMQ